VLEPSVERVVKCKQPGCETQRYHLDCVNLEQTPQNWICAVCKVSGRARVGKHIC
ncbi:hypothetical protein BYT27DRAFT_7093998, partial [Phlegmacium glaucopus]